MKSGTKVSPVSDCEDIQDKSSSTGNLKVLEAECKTGCKVQNGRFKSTVLRGLKLLMDGGHQVGVMGRIR